MPDEPEMWEAGLELPAEAAEEWRQHLRRLLDGFEAEFGVESDVMFTGEDPKAARWHEAWLAWQALTANEHPTPPPPLRRERTTTVEELRNWAEGWQSEHPGYGPGNYVDAFRDADGELLESDGFARADIRFALLAHLEVAGEQQAPRKTLRSSWGKLKHLADLWDEVDVAAVRAELTKAAERSLDEAPLSDADLRRVRAPRDALTYTREGEDPELTDDSQLLERSDLQQSLAEMAPGEGRTMRGGELPPGPWKWQRVAPQGPTAWGWPEVTEPGDGEALVAADGQWIVSSETGYGRPEVHPAACPLLEQAWLLGVKADEGALKDDRVEASVAVGLLNEVKSLTELLQEARRDRDEARAWAWSLEHGPSTTSRWGSSLTVTGGLSSRHGSRVRPLRTRRCTTRCWPTSPATMEPSTAPRWQD